MRDTRLIMGMPVTVNIAETEAKSEDLEKVFSYFIEVDNRFSTYKDSSEISQINRQEITENNYSNEMKEIFSLAEKTKQQTNGYFDIKMPDGSLDPSGIVKGWAIQKAAELIKQLGYKNFYVDAGGDIQSEGRNNEGQPWSVGIRHPFDLKKIAKVIYPQGAGVATSGNYLRGDHIYNPNNYGQQINEVVSLTVIGPNILEADRFATAAFAMGKNGVEFIENLSGFESYSIDNKGIATMTSGFKNYTKHA